MQGSEGYEVDEPTVIHERYDDEVLIVNLKDGAYFSLVDGGAVAWGLLVMGASVDDLVAAFERRYDGPRDVIEAALTGFLAGLESAGLVRRRAATAAWVDTWSGGRMPFSAPRIDRYTDIEEHMKVDPVHEVDERGWLAPRAR